MRTGFYVFDDRGHANFQAGASDLERVRAGGQAGEPPVQVLDAVIARIVDLGYEWGVSDGN